MAYDEIKSIAVSVTDPVPETTEELRRKIETILIEKGFTKMAKNYVVECYKNEERRKREKLDKSVLGLISRSNEDVMNENAKTELKTSHRQKLSMRLQRGAGRSKHP